MKSTTKFLAIQSEEWSEEERLEFEPVAQAVNKHIEDFHHHRKLGQRAKMLAIGELEEYKSKHPQRSRAARLIKAGYQSEGWSESVISENATAYRAYKSYKEHTEKIFNDFADSMPIYLLTLIGREAEALKKSGDPYAIDWVDPIKRSLTGPVFEYWKRNNKCPSQSQIRGYLGGFFNEKFKPRFSGTTPGPSIAKENQAYAVVDLEYSNLNPCIDSSEPPAYNQIGRLANILENLDVDDLSTTPAVNLRLLSPYSHKLETLTRLINTMQPIQMQ